MRLPVEEGFGGDASCLTSRVGVPCSMLDRNVAEHNLLGRHA
jgi:hypothetical protein